jgi:hypothetical protein
MSEQPSEHQIDLPIDATFGPEPSAPPELRDEIARAWSLPLGERVEVSFRDGQLDTLAGVLELAAAPDFPWNPREPLTLRIAGFVFSTRDIERWTRV